jgi:hypothetical protein
VSRTDIGKLLLHTATCSVGWSANSGNSIESTRTEDRPLRCQREVPVTSTCTERSPFRLARPSLPSFLSVSQSGGEGGGERPRHGYVSALMVYKAERF